MQVNGTIHVVGGDQPMLLVGSFERSVPDAQGFRAIAQCVIDAAIDDGYLSDNPITEQELDEERELAETHLTDNGFYVDYYSGVDIYKGVLLDEEDTNAIFKLSDLNPEITDLAVFADFEATVVDIATKGGMIRVITIDPENADHTLGVAITVDRCDKIPGGVSFTPSTLVATTIQLETSTHA